MKKTISTTAVRTIATLLTGAVLSAAAQASGNGGGGGGGGGGGRPPAPAPVPAPAPAPVAILPSTPPTPDTLMRESFGMADLARPAGGKGSVSPYQVGKSITGFWVEYPGSKDTAWLAPAEGQTWRVCGASTDPYEMPSPLQARGNGCIVSEWRDAITSQPSALMPFRAPAAAYEISVDAMLAPLPDQYLGFGFTDASVLDSNLETSGALWVSMHGSGTSATYELRTGGTSGPVLAAGTTSTTSSPYLRVVVRYQPATGSATASVNDAVLGTFAVPLGSPRFIAIEGRGIADNFVVRRLP